MTIQLEPEIENELDEAALQTGETKDSLVRKALHSYLEDIHDTRIALERLKNPGRRIPLHEVAKKFGLDDAV